MNIDPSSGFISDFSSQQPEEKEKPKVVVTSSSSPLPGHDTKPLTDEVKEVKVVSATLDSSSEVNDVELWYKQTIANMREYGITNVDVDNIEDIQDFFSNNYSFFLGSLSLAAQQKIGPPPTEFAIIGLGSLGRYEAGPYSDLDFAILIEKDNPEIRKYFLTMASEMNKIVMSLNEGVNGISFCEGGLTPPFMQGKSTVQFGSSALLDTPESMAEWSLPTHTPKNFERRENLANPGTISNSMTFSQFMYGDQTLIQRMREATQVLMQQTPEKDEIASYKKWQGGINYGKLVGLQLIQPGQIQPQRSAEANLKKGVLSPIMNIVRGLCIYHGINETNITEGLIKLEKQGHISPKLAVRVIETYQAAYKKRLQLQMSEHNSTYQVQDLTKGEKEEMASVVKDLQQRAEAFTHSRGKSNPFF